MTNNITEARHTVAEDGLKTYITKDYDQFIMLEDNRMINQNHVLELMEAIKQKPEGLRFEPIMVNEKWEIIDGQHRLKACQKLGYPVYYQIGKGLNVDDAIRMNVYRRNWTPLDFAYSYAGRGNDNYQRYLNVHHQYGNLPHETLITYLRNGDTKRSYAEFRKGEFVVPDDQAAVLDRITRYLQIVDMLPNPKVGLMAAFGRAVLSMFRNKGYDHERMIGKMGFAVNKYLTAPFLTVEDAVRALEAVYNESARTGDRVRFF
jgi:hypothetical protein